MSKVTIKCDGIGCDNGIDCDIPDSWLSRIGDIDTGGDSSYLFCPDCAIQGQWFASVCPGCVSSFPDCSFGKFRYKGNDITESELSLVRVGRCPARANGTFCLWGDGFKSIDLSEKASCESGVAVAEAIIRYIKKYKGG